MLGNASSDRCQSCNRRIEVSASSVDMSYAQHTHTHALYEYHRCRGGYQMVELAKKCAFIRGID